MSAIADNATAKLSMRMRAIPEKLRTISDLADPYRHRPLVRALTFRRFSTLQLMILVAVVAVFFGMVRVWHNRWYCQRQAAFHEDMAAFHRGWRPTNMNTSDAARLAALVPRRPELAILHSRMKIKWQNAATYPWLRVERDPPELFR